VFKGSVPGPYNEKVIVVLRVKDGKRGWRVMRRYETRAGGIVLMRYRFKKDDDAYDLCLPPRVGWQSGYPYEPGVSRASPQRVEP